MSPAGSSGCEPPAPARITAVGPRSGAPVATVTVTYSLLWEREPAAGAAWPVRGECGHLTDVNDLVERQPSRADRLLAGEAQDTESLQDAEHWLAVYEELTAFLLQVELDVSETLARFHVRREHWRRRRQELGGQEQPGS